MATYTIAAGSPELPVLEGMAIKLEAIDPSTGAAVTGVSASHWAIYGTEGATSDLTDVVPLYTAEEIGEPA